MAPKTYAPKSTPRWLVGLTLVVMLTVPFLFPVLILFATPLNTPAGLDALAAWLGITSAFGRDALTVAALLLVAFLFLNFGAIFSGMCVWWERRIAGRMQSRIGPNRQGLGG